MIANNPLDKSFGPAVTSAGIVIFVVGLITTYSTIYGLILVFLGAFFGFTSTSTLIDPVKNRVKFSNNFFGIIRIGQWINAEPDMKIGIRKTTKIWWASSLSNRTLDIARKDFRIFLYNTEGERIIPLGKADTHDSAIAELKKLSNQLGLKFM